ncbi:hypothetical protein D3C73_1595530 [compost metagenome]
MYTAKNLRVLELSFKNQIKIPDQLAEISILTLKLHGKITEEEEKRIFKLFPKTQIIINDKGPELKVIKGIR